MFYFNKYQKYFLCKKSKSKFRLYIAKLVGIFLNVEICVSWNYEFAC